MKTIEQLETLRDELIEVFHSEGKKLASWDSDYVANLPKDQGEIAVVKANSQLMSNLGAAISSLTAMIKNMDKKEPPIDKAVEALNLVRHR